MSILKTKSLLSVFLLIVFASSLQIQQLSHQFYKGDLKAFRQAELDKHNKYRKVHHSGNLKLSDKLNSIAQKWAQHLAQIDSMEHQGEQLGSNLLCITYDKPQAYPLGAASDEWYRASQNYDFSNPGYTDQSGPFTNLVWKGSKNVGFGIASTRDKKKDYIVANYDPRGNVQNQFEDNVLPA